MSKILELKYDVGDIGYTMLGVSPAKVEIINFNLSYDRKLPIEYRIQYEVKAYNGNLKEESLEISYLSNYLNTNYVNTCKGLDEIFDTKEELIKSLTNKIEKL